MKGARSPNPGTAQGRAVSAGLATSASITEVVSAVLDVLRRRGYRAVTVDGICPQGQTRPHEPVSSLAQQAASRGLCGTQRNGREPGRGHRGRCRDKTSRRRSARYCTQFGQDRWGRTLAGLVADMAQEPSWQTSSAAGSCGTTRVHAPRHSRERRRACEIRDDPADGGDARHA